MYFKKYLLEFFTFKFRLKSILRSACLRRTFSFSSPDSFVFCSPSYQHRESVLYNIVWEGLRRKQIVWQPPKSFIYFCLHCIKHLAIKRTKRNTLTQIQFSL